MLGIKRGEINENFRYKECYEEYSKYQKCNEDEKYRDIYVDISYIFIDDCDCRGWKHYCKFQCRK